MNIAEGNSDDTVEALDEGIGIDFDEAGVQRSGLVAPEGEDDGVIFDGVFDAFIGDFGDGIEDLGKSEVFQRRDDLDEDLAHIDRLGRSGSRDRQAGSGIDGSARRSSGAGIDIGVNDEVDAALLGIAFLGFIAEVLNDFAQGQAVILDRIKANAV